MSDNDPVESCCEEMRDRLRSQLFTAEQDSSTEEKQRAEKAVLKEEKPRSTLFMGGEKF